MAQGGAEGWISRSSRTTSLWSRTSSAIRSSRRSARTRRRHRWAAPGRPGDRLHLRLEHAPIGQLLWEKELMSYKTYPPLQAPETYNLDGILRAIQSRGAKGD